MFTNFDFIHTRLCYDFLNENNHHEYSVLFIVVYGWKEALPISLDYKFKPIRIDYAKDYNTS